MLVLLMGEIYEVRHWDGLGHYDIYTTYMTNCPGIQVILRLLTQQFERLRCWYYCWEGFVKYTVEMAVGGMIYIRSFATEDTEVLLWLQVKMEWLPSRECVCYTTHNMFQPR